MKCYFVATPYHIMAATCMAAGMNKGEKNILVIYNHFAFDDDFVNKVTASGPFDNVYVYNYSNKNVFTNIKRAFNVIFPDRLLRKLKRNKEIDEFIFFSLDFLAASYLNKKRGNIVSYGDDGMGAYFNGNCYKPNDRVLKILRLLKREENYQNITKLYVYKPNYILLNKRLDLIKIIQNEQSNKAVEKLVNVLWPFENLNELYDHIIFFEQPFVNDYNNERLNKIISILKEISKLTDKKILIKMHPRSNNEKAYSDFEIYHSKAPFEAILYQIDNNRQLSLLCINSTSVFSPYFIDKLNSATYKAIILKRLFDNIATERYDTFINIIKAEKGNECKLIQANNMEEIKELLR